MILDDIDKTYKKINDAGHILKIISNMSLHWRDSFEVN